MTTIFTQRVLDGSLARAAALCLLALAAVLLRPSEARAQWTTSGTNTTTTNNVGVGTPAPTDSLEINGNVTNGAGLTITTSGNAKYRTGTVGTSVPNWGGQLINAKYNQGVGQWTMDDTSLNAAFVKLDLRNHTFANEIGFYRMAAGANPRPDAAWSPMAQFKLDTGNILLAPASGNVGIGTATPGVLNGVSTLAPYLPLHIQGQGTNPASVVVNSASPYSGFVINDSSQPVDGRMWSISQAAGAGKLTFRTYTDSGSAASDRLVIDRAGNVGVGTVAPNYNLVVGPSLPSGFVYASMTVSRGANASSSIIVGESGSRLAEVGWDNPNARAFLNAAGSTPIAITQNGSNVRMFVTGVGDIGMGTTTPASKLHVVGDITVTGNINAKYQDVAEWVPSTQKLQAGTVVVLDTGRDNHVLASKGSYDTRVAGVISAQPGLSLGEKGEGKVLVATTGRVKVKVDASRAPIRIGDLIVTSDAEGVAMKSVPVELGGVAIHRPGTLIGKALESLEKGTGEILVLLSLQ